MNVLLSLSFFLIPMHPSAWYNTVSNKRTHKKYRACVYSSRCLVKNFRPKASTDLRHQCLVKEILLYFLRDALITFNFLALDKEILKLKGIFLGS